MLFFFFKQKTAYEIKECDWSSDVCSSDLTVFNVEEGGHQQSPVIGDKMLIEDNFDMLLEDGDKMLLEA